MSGITSVLNIAKQAILAHQMSMVVTGNNVANVDTPGYTRQGLHLSENPSYTSVIGPIGSGVTADYINRYYDQFVTARIMQEASISSGLDAKLESINLVSAAFNEAPGLGLNDLLSQFWASWQNLADNPEFLPSKQSVVQQASLLADQFQNIYAEANRTKNDIGVNLTNSIDSINALTKQIAALNVEITTMESGNTQANDLRDKRDLAIKDLAEQVNINYFETDDGTYTVLLSDGHALVEVNESWQVSWENDSLQWVTYRRGEHNEPIEVKTNLGSGADLGGKVGGLVEIYNMLNPNDPDSFLGQLNSLTYSLIREVNQQVSQGVGEQSFSGELVGTELADDAAILTSTVNTATASESIAAGIFTINNRSVGKINGSVLEYGLAMGKGFNAATAINNAYAGVTAKLTTQVAGQTVIALGASDVGSLLDFTVNGVNVSYTVQAGDVDPATFAANMAAAVNNAIAANNADPANGPDLTIQALVGDGTNGGAVNSVIFRNTNEGDDSHIVIDGIDKTGIEANLGLDNDIYNADASHNTGELTLFSVDPFTVKAGSDDKWLYHFNWDGGTISKDDVANDGQFTYSSADRAISNSLQGFAFADELQTDGGSFDMWIYNSDGTLALSQPVTVSLDRAYTLGDVANAVNEAISVASGGVTPPYVQATVSKGQFRLITDTDHQFAFANDTSNFLQAAGLNTIFSGYNAGNIGVNPLLEHDVTNLAAGRINEFGEFFKGDNSNALLVTNIQRDENIAFRGRPNSSLDGFYNSLIGQIGLQGQSIQRDQQFHEVLSGQMSQLRDSVSGVSLDEEMANLIKYQHAYSAAAKLITMADEMLVTLLQSV